ncbi:unnamed protein product [Phaedon cochleariae]|uniref:CCHC-type domain-containing protein n=1 Tax=Phaedon cochleariae TaxID=80249 RepID=A0A9P0DSL1_PHACE|nr:unnamed protein product [Phaedon cochleariae]
MTEAFTEIFSQLKVKENEDKVVDILNDIKVKINDINVIQNQNISNKNSYATVASTPSSTTKIPLGKGNTTIPSKDQVILIYPKKDNNNIKSSEETLKIPKKLRTVDVGVKPEKLLPISKNGVKINTSLAQVNEHALNAAGLTAEKPEKFKPRLAIMGVPAEWTAEIVGSKINEDLELDPEDTTRVKALFKYGRRNETTVTWVIECNYKIRDIILKRGELFYDWNACNVRDHIRLLTCYNCQNYGHMAANCRRNITCGYCTGEHDAKNCKSREDPVCINCKLSKEANVNHEAHDTNCPKYTRRLQSYINNTDYGP